MSAKRVEFELPTVLEAYEEVSTKEELVEKLRETVREAEIDLKEVTYRCCLKKGLYLYAKCSRSGCRAYLRYRQVAGGRYELSRAETRHQHMAPRGKNIRFAAASSYINSLPPSVPACSLRYAVCREFGLGTKQFYYVLKKARSPSLTVSELVASLEDKGYQIFTDQLDGEIELFLAFSEQMRADFEEHGSVVSFDLTFNLVKGITASGKRWKLGCFLGSSRSRRLVPLGLVLTTLEDHEVYVRIFKTFFQAMRGCPGVLVTDDERAMGAALTEMKVKKQFTGEHFLDGFHVLRNVRKALEDKSHLLYFKKMLQAKTRAAFNWWQSRAREQLSEKELPVLDRFLLRKESYCFCHTPLKFLGFSASSSPNEGFHNLLKTSQPSEKTFSTTVLNALRVIEQLQLKANQFDLEKAPYQTMLQIPELRLIRHSLARPVFCKFVTELAKSIRTQIYEGEEHSYLVKQWGALYVVNNRGDGFRCNCGYPERTALPCRHLLRVAIVERLALMDLIDPRWLLMVPPPRKTSLAGRERSSRRNRIR